MGDRSSWRLAGITIAVGLFACRAEERVSHDLVELFDEASVVYETGTIDFGASDARRHLVGGFSQDETLGNGDTFVWSEGASSELRLAIHEPRELSLTFRCWPFRFEGAPVQAVTVVLNEIEIAELELAPEPGEYHVPLPLAHQLAGDNRLRIRYRYQRTPSEVLPGANDDRLLAVGWDWLRVDGALAPAPPVARGDGRDGSLRLRRGARLDYFVHLFPESRFVVASVRAEGDAELVVSVETWSSHSDHRVETPARRTVLAIPSGELTRISLRAVGGDVVVRHPALWTASAESVGADQSDERRPNIIVYLIDTLRADHLGCYGYPKPTPRIDELAADGTLFERALAQSSWTKPATASLLTGLHPRAHNANAREDALPSAVRTLPQDLKALGYQTAGVVVNANVSATFGFDRGFDTFELLMHEDGIVGADGAELVDRAIEALAGRASGAPLFLYVHAAEPHDPYGTSGFHGEGFGSVRFMESLEEERVTLSEDELARLVALYDDDVARADTELGRFVDALKAEGLYHDALIVVVSDHGEEFHDHGRWRHGKTLYTEQLHVPLIIKWPGGVASGRRVGNVVQQIDLVPTVLDYVGAERGRALPGRSLWSLASAESGRPESADPPALAYVRVDDREVESVVVGEGKLIRYLDYDRPVGPYQLFDLGADPAESTDLSGERLRRTGFLDAYARHATPAPVAEVAPVVIDGDVERQLRALGYLR